MISSILFSGMALGLANNIGCIAVCAPVFLPYLFSQERRPVIPLLQFMAGRLIAYLLFAATAGWLGIFFEGRIDVRIFSVLTLILSLWMIANALGTLKPHIRFCGALQGRATATFPFYAGFVLGINVCPPFLMGLSTAMAMNSILKPLLFFTGFYVGSSAWLLPLALTGAITGKPVVAKIAGILALLVGCWYLYRSASDILIVFR